jgi:hypothetical protein
VVRLIQNALEEGTGEAAIGDGGSTTRCKGRDEVSKEVSKKEAVPETSPRRSAEQDGKILRTAEGRCIVGLLIAVCAICAAAGQADDERQHLYRTIQREKASSGSSDRNAA